MSNAQRRRQRKHETREQHRALRPQIPRVRTSDDEALDELLVRRGWHRLGWTYLENARHPTWHWWGPADDLSDDAVVTISLHDPGYHVLKESSQGDVTETIETMSEVLARLDALEAWQG